MQYQDFVDTVETRYFGNVSRGAIAAVLACFTADARVVIYHGDRPPRRFRRDGHGEEDLAAFYRHLWENYRPGFDRFRHYVDVPAGRCASTFRVTLEPRAGSPYADHGVQQLDNCNFFDFRGELLERMIIYYANPRAGASGAPTGYPPAPA